MGRRGGGGTTLLDYVGAQNAAILQRPTTTAHSRFSQSNRRLTFGMLLITHYSEARPKTTSSQTWPKPYNKLQLPGGLFYSGFQPTVEYQEMNKRTSLQRRVPEENSMATMSASMKRRLSLERSRCQGHR